MRRFGRSWTSDRLRRELPLTPFFFDLLYRDGQPLLDEPEERRFAALSEVTSGGLLVPRTVTASADAAQAFLDQSLARGTRGSWPSAGRPVRGGGRGQRWLKVKPAHTLDLVGARGGVGARPPPRGSRICISVRATRRAAASSSWEDRSRHDRRDARVADQAAAQLEIGRDGLYRACPSGARGGSRFNDDSEPATMWAAWRFASRGSNVIARLRPPRRGHRRHVRQILQRSHDPAAADDSTGVACQVEPDGYLPACGLSHLLSGMVAVACTPPRRRDAAPGRGS